MLVLASEQRGAFARWQVLGHGGDDALIRRRCRSGRWERAANGVYVLGGLPPDPERRLWVAFLAVGEDVVVSHECAAERQQLWPVPIGRIVFTSRHGDHHYVPGVVVHQLKDVLPHHLTIVGGLPTTTVPRTIVDLAAVTGIERLSRIVEHAINEKRTTEAVVGVVLGDVARPG